MREALAILAGARIDVQATVLKRGKRRGWTGAKQPTLLLGDVATLDGVVVCDRVWIPEGKRLAVLALCPGDVVRFSGRVGRYHRHGHAAQANPEQATDYAFTYPLACTVVARAATELPVIERATTPADRLLDAIRLLWQRDGTPPAVYDVCEASGMRPWKALRQLHALACRQQVRFLPDGHIFPTRMEVSA